MISENKKEYFIDLQSLAHGAMHEGQYTVFFFQNNAGITDDNIIYLMRKAVRKTGYKITQIKRKYSEHNSDILIQLEFYTNMPEEVHEESIRVYNEWVAQVGLD
jgi:hypothetical protein